MTTLNYTTPGAMAGHYSAISKAGQAGQGGSQTNWLVVILSSVLTGLITYSIMKKASDKRIAELKRQMSVPSDE